MDAGQKTGLTYANSGVSYADIDTAKIDAQHMASATIRGYQNLFGPIPLREYIGESAFVWKLPNGAHIAHVTEGLGTKVLLADFIYENFKDPSGYEVIGIDAAAMILNDLASVGVPPISLQMHLAVGAGEWLKDSNRMIQLNTGWALAAADFGSAWTGGETPVLPGIVNDSAVIGGSAFGYLPNSYLPITNRIKAGDAIVILASSGVHANGISLIRKIAQEYPKKTEELYREALVPTRLYSKAVDAIRKAGVIPNYAIHITGHGWRKMMRANSDFTYIIEKLLPVQPIFEKIQEAGNVELEEMWGNYNMGAGFAFMVSSEDAEKTARACSEAGYEALIAGHVEEGPKRVVIDPVGIEFKKESMQLR